MTKELLQQALEDICKGAPTALPERYEGDNHGDAAFNAAERGHFRVAEIARSALAQPVQPADGWISEKGVRMLMKTEYDRGYRQCKHDSASPIEKPAAWQPIKLSDAPPGLEEIYPEDRAYQFLAPRGDGSVAGDQAWLITLPPLPAAQPKETK